MTETETKICPLMGGKPCAESRCKWWMYVGRVPNADGTSEKLYDCAVREIARS